jgi:hypothetical protein
MARTLVHWIDALIRDRLDETECESKATLELIASVGARRFEAQMLAMTAIVALRRGDRATARERAEQALAVCRQHGMGHIGPWLHGVFAQIETDPDVRRRWLDEGERLLGLGCVSHNQVQLPELAIDALVEIGDWAGVEKQCEHLRSYTAAEPLALCDFVVARAMALVAVGRGEHGEVLRASLVDLRERGAAAELNSFLPAIDCALERLATATAR